jgi:hypothetical protein
LARGGRRLQKKPIADIFCRNLSKRFLKGRIVITADMTDQRIATVSQGDFVFHDGDPNVPMVRQTG